MIKEALKNYLIILLVLILIVFSTWSLIRIHKLENSLFSALQNQRELIMGAIKNDRDNLINELSNEHAYARNALVLIDSKIDFIGKFPKGKFGKVPE